jgi:hypothetical protein
VARAGKDKTKKKRKLKMGDISKNFSFHEFTTSHLFPEIAKLIKLAPLDKINLSHLVLTILQPERNDSNIITDILQGKRSQELHNALKIYGLKPSETSQHFCNGPLDFAIDLRKRVLKTDNNSIDIAESRIITKQFYYWTLHHCRHAFGELIYYTPSTEYSTGFCHISTRTPKHNGSYWINDNQDNNN